MRDLHYVRMCFLSQLKPSELFRAKNVELLGLYPIEQILAGGVFTM